MAISPVKMFVYSHKNSFTEKQESEICKEIIIAEDKYQLLSKFKQEALTCSMFETAYLSSNDNEEKFEIISYMPEKFIKKLRSVEMICAVLAQNPLKFRSIDFDYFIQPEKHEDYARILVTLGKTLDNHIKAFEFRGELTYEDECHFEALKGLKNLHEAECLYAEEQMHSKDAMKKEII